MGMSTGGSGDKKLYPLIYACARYTAYLHPSGIISSSTNSYNKPFFMSCS